MNKIKQHLKAVRALHEIKKGVIGLLKKKKVSERQTSNFIFKEYRKRGMQAPPDWPKVIVAFGKNTANIHHSSKKNKLENGPVMIDAFAKFKNGCYADFTWMFYKGKPAREFVKNFKIVVGARNSGLRFIKRCLRKRYLPTLLEIDAVARAYLAENCVGYSFGHRLSHSLGKKVHDGGKKEQNKKIELNKPYTIEPGVYFRKKYGIRIENDFYADRNFKLHAAKPQNKLIRI